MNCSLTNKASLSPCHCWWIHIHLVFLRKTDWPQFCDNWSRVCFWVRKCKHKLKSPCMAKDFYLPCLFVAHDIWYLYLADDPYLGKWLYHSFTLWAISEVGIAHRKTSGRGMCVLTYSSWPNGLYHYTRDVSSLLYRDMYKMWLYADFSSGIISPFMRWLRENQLP